MFVRSLVRDGGMVRPMASGDGMAANYSAISISANVSTTLTEADIAGGLILRSGMTANRIDTTPTAVLLAAAFPDMNIGDTLSFKVSNQDSAQTVTLAGGAGVTASGNLIVIVTTMKEFILEKTAADTFNLIGL